ncbi:hypothetical protein [Leptolyngbya sp. NK1-12]|nr:hypothetical protein [Leptolyngbya sp. NK1-12]
MKLAVNALFGIQVAALAERCFSAWSANDHVQQRLMTVELPPSS